MVWLFQSYHHTGMTLVTRPTDSTVAALGYFTDKIVQLVVSY